MRRTKEDKAILSLLLDFRHGEWKGKESINYRFIPVTVLSMEQKGADLFNKIYRWGLKRCISFLDFTPSGNISKYMLLPNVCAARVLKTCVELVIILEEGLWRIQFRSTGSYQEDVENDKWVPGTRSFSRFKAACKARGVDLDGYAIEDGPKVKESIESPLIKLVNLEDKDVEMTGVHHVDFHNSYPAGLCNNYEEFRPIIEKWYKNRHKKPEYKLMLNSMVGYMQSTVCCGAKWAHMAKAAIEDNNRRVKELAARIEADGSKIILYNTDGFWYQGPVYHGEGEGPNLGEWQNDHLDCRFRAKSNGVYEFEEDGEYHPVVRGRTWLDRYLDRKHWQWGDIYNPDAEHIIEWKFIEGEGIYEQEEDIV